jgi:hypothetical protein
MQDFHLRKLALSLFLGVGLSTTSIYSSSASGCDAPICASNPDLAEISEKSKAASKAQMDAVNDIYNKMNEESFAPKDDMAGASCLDGMYGIAAQFEMIDPTNAFKLDYQKILMDYIKKTGCAIIVENSNEFTKKLNAGLNEAGENLAAQTGGLVSFSSSTNTSGDFSATKKTTQLQDSELMENISRDVNEAVNKEFFGESDPLNGRNNVDLTDERYYSNDAKSGTKKESTNFTADELEAGALCFLNGC